MKKILVLAAFSLFAVDALAQSRNKAVGYDTGLGMVTYRMGMGGENPNQTYLDLGVGLDHDDKIAKPGKKPSLGVGGFYLMPFQNFVSSFQNDDKLRMFVYGGGIFTMNAGHTDKHDLSVAGGFQPEFFLHPRVSIEARIGLNLTVIDKLHINTFGNGVSIVNGAAFKVYFD